MANSMKDRNLQLNTPSVSTVKPPVFTRAMELPFDELLWEDFEKLCVRLVKLEAQVERSTLYGVRGEEQAGIDILARITGQKKHHVYQCKKVTNFGPSKIKAAVAIFLDGEWVTKSDVFAICTSESLRSTNRAKEIETQAAILKAKDVQFVIWDKDELSEKLKLHPKLVDDFFSREWVKVFCGQEAANLLGNRLDSDEVKKYRQEFYRLYKQVFSIHDRGIPLADALPLSERFVVPDVIERNIALATLSSHHGKEMVEAQSENAIDDQQKQRPKFTPSREYSQRSPIDNWVSRGNLSLLFGDPGSGKSTFLRFLALDILSEEPTLEEISDKWGSFLPVWIPFALWTKIIHQGSVSDSSVKGVVKALLTSWSADFLVPLVEKALEDDRLLILVDGLDEHSNNEAAKIALNHLDTFLSLKRVPAIVTTRPHGFERLGMKTDGWQEAEIADLSREQQEELVVVWFAARSRQINPAFDEAARSVSVGSQKDTFFAELDRSQELREISRNPLLLSLLISFQIKNIRLPTGRFEAYQSLTDHLISVHPQARRVAAQVTGQTELIDQVDLKKILAHLAYTLQIEHPEGLITEVDAITAMAEFLVDDINGLGMSRSDAMRTSKNILTKAENSLGILVKKSSEEIGFYHRTIQEYLTTFHISRLSLDEQLNIVDTHAVGPSWREVILGLLQITQRSEDVRQMVEIIKTKRISFVDGKSVDSLLSEVAFGNFNCPPNLARELAKYFFEKIETETWLPHRKKILSHALNGLHSSVMAGMVKEKVTEWFPNRVGWGMSRIFEAMETWPMSDDVWVTLSKGLNSEDYNVKLTSMLTLAKIAKNDEIIGDKLTDIATHTDDALILAAITLGMIVGWKKHKKTQSLIEKCASSQMPALELIAIKGKITFSTQTEKDLDRLLQLSSRDISDYSTRLETASLFVEGWPKSEKVKTSCLSALSHGIQNGRTLDRDVAYDVLLEGFPMDEKVADFCVLELENEKYPFNSISQNNFMLLAKNFRDHPKLVAALDVWVDNQEYKDRDVALVAPLGRTPAFKKHLINDLENSWPFWAAGVLLQEWGIEDPEVSAALFPLINGSADKASNFGRLMPKIFKDKEVCRKRLKEILKDPQCYRVDFVMGGLIDLKDFKDGKETVDIAIEILNKENKYFYNDSLLGNLAQYYSSDPRVRSLIMEALKEREAPFAEIARGFKEDNEIKGIISKIVTPLPIQLRGVIISFLSNGDVEDGFAVPLLKLYDLEDNEELKVQSSIGYHTRLKNSGVSAKDVVVRLSKDIGCYGPYHQERRLAAFCGLFILERLDVMVDGAEALRGEDRLLRISSIQGTNVNIPHLQFILRNWGKLRDIFKEDFFTRLFDRYSGFYVWNHLATVADQYPVAKQEVLEFFAKHPQKVGLTESLLFLSRAQPRSDLLLEYCLNTLGLNPDGPDRKADVNQEPHISDMFVAAKILGEQFFGRDDVLKIIMDSRNRDEWDAKVLALSEGWPNSDELNALLEEMARTRQQYWESTIIRFHVHKSGIITLFKLIRRLIRVWTAKPKYRSHEGISRSIIKRLKQDKSLSFCLIRYLQVTGKPSEKVSIAQLLYKANGLTPELRKWAEHELSKQLSTDGLEIAYDITIAEFISVPHSIYAILNQQ